MSSLHDKTGLTIDQAAEAIPAMREALSAVVHRVNAVDAQSKRDEYTDLDAVWETLYECRRLARRALKKAR